MSQRSLPRQAAPSCAFPSSHLSLAVHSEPYSQESCPADFDGGKDMSSRQPQSRMTLYGMRIRGLT